MVFGELPRHAPLGPPCRASPNDQVVGTGSRPSSGRQLMHLAETTILVVTARVPVWWGQNADLRLRSIFPFLFLKRPSTSHTRGLNLPPMSRRRWESTYVCTSRGAVHPLRYSGTTCIRKYHFALPPPSPFPSVQRASVSTIGKGSWLSVCCSRGVGAHLRGRENHRGDLLASFHSGASAWPPSGL